MEITNEVLEEICKLSACAYSPKQVAFMLGMKPSDFEALVKNEDDPVSIAYHRDVLSGANQFDFTVLA